MWIWLSFRVFGGLILRADPGSAAVFLKYGFVGGEIADACGRRFGGLLFRALAPDGCWSCRFS